MAFYDLTDTIAGKGKRGNRGSDGKNRDSGYVLEFFHVPTGEVVQFKAFLTDYQDRFESQWNEEETFGRMDPIQTFKRTTRIISLAWKVPSASEDEAIINLDKAEKLLSMLYPVYEESYIGQAIQQPASGSKGQMNQESKSGGRKVGVMVAPPLFKLKFANLIADTSALRSNLPTGNEDSKVRNRSVAASAENAGLVGTISGLKYRPDLNEEFFGPMNTQFSVEDESFTYERLGKIPEGYLIPQTIDFACDFKVIHTEGLGYRRKPNQTKPIRNPSFPHAGSILKSNLDEIKKNNPGK